MSCKQVSDPFTGTALIAGMARSYRIAGMARSYMILGGWDWWLVAFLKCKFHCDVTEVKRLIGRGYQAQSSALGVGARYL